MTLEQMIGKGKFEISGIIGWNARESGGSTVAFDYVAHLGRTETAYLDRTTKVKPIQEDAQVSQVS